MNCGINTNMHLERMHRTLKYVYLQGKQVKRLDKTINALMKLVRDKCFDYTIAHHKGKLTSTIANIRNRHKNSTSINVNSFTTTDHGWQYISTKLEIYNISKNMDSCNCNLKCTDCGNVCLHIYSCTCLDHCIKWNMCKHIHSLQKYLNMSADLNQEILSVNTG